MAARVTAMADANTAAIAKPAPPSAALPPKAPPAKPRSLQAAVLTHGSSNALAAAADKEDQPSGRAAAGQEPQARSGAQHSEACAAAQDVEMQEPGAGMHANRTASARSPTGSVSSLSALRSADSAEDSDFADGDQRGSDSDGSDSGAVGSESDGSYGARKRRRTDGAGAAARRRRPTPPDNDMRRKLRPAPAPATANGHAKHDASGRRATRGAAAAGTSQDTRQGAGGSRVGSAAAGSRPGSRVGSRTVSRAASAAEPETVEGSALGSDSDEPEEAASPAPVVLERKVSVEEEQRQREALGRQWELAAVYDFLHTFRRALALQRSFSARELEGVLATSPGGPGLLADLHMALLRGVGVRTPLTPSNWTAMFAHRLRHAWQAAGLPPATCPFAPQKGSEAVTYAALPTPQRVLALKALCELRLERDDLRELVEEALKAPPRSAKPPPKGQAALGPADVRKRPLGVDSSGARYWWLDAHQTVGSLLYKEVPEDASRGKGSKLRGTRRPPPGPGAWELLGSTADALQEAGEKLRRSKKKPDATLAAVILDQLVPLLAGRAAEEERRARAAAKLRLHVGDIILDDTGGFGRARRARKEVNYSFDAYDEAIKQALRGGRDDDRRPRGAAAGQPSKLQEALAGGRAARLAARQRQEPTGDESAAVHEEPAGDESPRVHQQPTGSASQHQAEVQGDSRDHSVSRERRTRAEEDGSSPHHAMLEGGAQEQETAAVAQHTAAESVVAGHQPAPAVVGVY